MDTKTLFFTYLLFKHLKVGNECMRNDRQAIHLELYWKDVVPYILYRNVTYECIFCVNRDLALLNLLST